MSTKTASFVFRLFSVLMLLALLVTTQGGMPARAAGTLFVKPGGTGNCASWADACTLQTALTNAVSGDIIWVAAGTHKPTTGTDRNATFQLKSGVGLYGGFRGTETGLSQSNPEANVTILSGDLNGDDMGLNNNGENVYHVVTGAVSAELVGFTVTGGNANGDFPNYEGGGMLNKGCSPHLQGVVFVNNSASIGAGMYNYESSPYLYRVTFSNNVGADFGGGMSNSTDSNPELHDVTFNNNSGTNHGGGMDNYQSSPTLVNVTFSDNSTEFQGGGMYNDQSNPTLTNVIFSGNTAGYRGGGMYNYYSSNPTLTNVTFSGNSAFGGGGMYNDQSNPTLTNVIFSGNTARYGGGMANQDNSSPLLSKIIFRDNTAQQYGGGMYTSGSSLWVANATFSGNSAKNGGGMFNSYGSPTLANVTFSGNSAGEDGGGMYNNSGSPVLTNVTFHANSAESSGGGMDNLAASNPQIRNTIFWGNTANIGAQIAHDATSVPVVSDSVVQYGWAAGTNIITADPKLGSLGDYGGFAQTVPLGTGSSAIDAGNDTTCTDYDQRGIDRPQDGDGNGSVVCDIGAYEAVFDSITPIVNFIFRVDPGITNLTNVGFTVRFSEPVAGVDAADFKLTNTILTGAFITDVSPSGSAYANYTVTVNTGTGNGTIRLDIPETASIEDWSGNAFVGPYTGEAFYEVYKETAPTVPVLKSPANGAQVTGYQPTLDWDDSSPVMALAVPGWHYEVNVTSPDGYDQTFITDDSDDPLAGLGESQYTFSAPLPESTTFTWKVRAYNDENQYSAWSASRTFRTKPATSTVELPAPTLTSPPNSTTLNNTRPTFHWDAVSGATTYTLQILKDGKAVNSGTVKAPLHSYTPAKDLLAGTTYNWQVKANGKVSSDYSAPFTFTTSSNPPQPPVLSNPPKGALVDGDQPVDLKWKPVPAVTTSNPTTSSPAAESFQVEYAADSVFTDSTVEIVNGNTIADTQLSLPAGTLLPNRTYYWRVRSWSARDAGGNQSVWSIVRTFRTPLATPVLNLPADSTILDTTRPTFAWDEVPGAKTYTLQILNGTKAVVTGAIKAPAYVYTSVKDLLPNTVYTWKVKANGANPGEYSEPFTFTTSGNPPKAPVLILPTNGIMVDSTTTLTYKWSPVPAVTTNDPATTYPAALSYEFEFAYNPTFRNHSAGIVSVTELPSSGRSPGRTYYWRVRSWSGVGGTGNHSAWSAVRMIKVKYVPPSLTSPANGDTFVPVRPTFKWSSANGLWTFYTLQIAPTNAFGKGMRTFTIKAPVTKYTIPASQFALLGSTQYCWRVKINGPYFPVLSDTVNCFTTAP